jgi:isopentenyl diphosphate isomerase/L-lactate dehydrogenase-like FMN-dependent dehydrogenase
MTKLDDIRTMRELVTLARQMLAPAVWDYLVGGSQTQTTMARSRAALDSREFRPRILRDVSSIDLSARFHDRKVDLPVFLAPIGSLALLNAGASLASARAASVMNVPMFMSIMAQPAMESVAPEIASPFVFQIYVRGDEEWLSATVARAEKAGCAAICLTVDSPVYGRRERDLINRFSSAAVVDRPNFSESGVPSQIAPQQAGLTWETVRWLRRRTQLPLILKGIMSAEDAVLAVEHGVEMVYVSNHGGRQLDHAPGALDLLADIAPHVRGRCTILVDGGFMRGTDILKALALGADAVGLGKLHGLALAAGGQAGVVRMLEILREELSVNMALLGCCDIGAVGPDCVRTSGTVCVRADPLL